MRFDDPLNDQGSVLRQVLERRAVEIAAAGFGRRKKAEQREGDDAREFHGSFPVTGRGPITGEAERNHGSG